MFKVFCSPYPVPVGSAPSTVRDGDRKWRGRALWPLPLSLIARVAILLTRVRFLEVVN